MDGDMGAWLLQLGKIIWINILLSGDNAVVIALACRALPPKTRLWGIVLGAGVAIVMRIFFTVIVTTLMTWPYLKIIGGALLFWIAIQLLVENTDENDVKESHTIWAAVRVVAIADLVMSLDNVIAIAGAAQGVPGETARWSLIIIGLATSIPLIVFGAQLVILILERFPLLVWAGAALLGWIAGELIAEEPALQGFLHAAPAMLVHYGLPTLGALFVVAMGYLLRKRHGEKDVEAA